MHELSLRLAVTEAWLQQFIQQKEKKKSKKMERFLRPERFDCNPNSSSATQEWNHWFRTFKNFLSSVEQHEPNKLDTLINYIAPSVYEYIADTTSYDAAVEILEKLYVRPKNEVYARHLLAGRRQQPGETLDEFLQALKQLGKDCNYKAVTAEQYREESIRDAFLVGSFIWLNISF